MSNEFWNRLEARSSAISSLLCVGLDPTIADLTSAKLLTADRTPAAAALEFCKKLVVATAPYAAAFKPNSAFFEAFGPEGFAALIELHRFIKHDVDGNIPILLDVKRGDIATTAEAYATASFSVLDADAVTLNAYMGVDALSPFLTAEGGKRGVFVLCKTSNKSADEIQTLQLKPSASLPSTSGGMQVYEAVAHHSTGLWAKGGYKIGLVVGATDPVALAAVRKIAPTSWILAPGIGAQGGDLERALEAGLTADGTGLLLPISRGISKAEDPAQAAAAFQKQINALVATILEKRTSARSSSSAAAGVSAELRPHQREFLQAAMEASVLKFGSFTLKSGRISPYFFNAGKFETGRSIAAIGRTYAAAIVDSKVEFDVLFGPAYKGIPLATTTAIALAENGMDLPVAYNRKEAKDHGEGGTIVGASVAGKRVLIIDDVITAGTAVNEALGIISAAGGIPVGVVVGLDRQERGLGDTTESAVQQVQKMHSIPVVAVASLANLVALVEEVRAIGGSLPGYDAAAVSELLSSVQKYRSEYGVC